MAGHLLLLLTLFAAHVVSASLGIHRRVPDPSPTETYTYKTDTVIKPTANARFQVGIPIDVVWYIPQTPYNTNGAESFNITIALGGEVAMELSNSVSFPGYGEQDTTFTPDETWPESNKYQIFILMDFGTKTLTSPNFGIWGGGQTPTPTSIESEASSTSVSKASKTIPPSTTTPADASTTSDIYKASTASASTSASPTAVAAAGVSPTILGGAIGGAILGTLAIVGILWFMRKRMAESRANHGITNPNANGNYPPPSYPSQTGNGGQAWTYQQMNAHSTASINNDYKGFAPTNAVVNEMPTHIHQEPVELYAMKERVEMPGDSSWNIPPPPAPSQQPYPQKSHPQRYVYGPDSYNQ
ncbi:hypothetical protein H072_5844 [Dactylellina haptotyla CBS 200.50]|uniref:Mid2 domain-containing protein n=1 Tax=Dactylellina haptotyla (strain CBS 200.50) TaxID=1284197 RepID=S8BYE9_DACHA|nr:hypothetical protein H072_5844 [Dactylellina haptotyla CBS 200.50]